jgi:hypothetical protein
MSRVAMRRLNKSDLRHGRVNKYVEKQAHDLGISRHQYVDDFITSSGLPENIALQALIDAAKADHAMENHGRIEHG